MTGTLGALTPHELHELALEAGRTLVAGEPLPFLSFAELLH